MTNAVQKSAKDFSVKQNKNPKKIDMKERQDDQKIEHLNFVCNIMERQREKEMDISFKEDSDMLPL